MWRYRPGDAGDAGNFPKKTPSLLKVAWGRWWAMYRSPVPRLYFYVGPPEVAKAALAQSAGTSIHPQPRRPRALVQRRTRLARSHPDATLRLAPRRSEHVGCALGGPVLAAGELILSRRPRLEVISFSNQSTGYCPEPDCIHVIQTTLAKLPVPCPPAFSRAYEFRLCIHCGERNLIKDGYFECDCCGQDLPLTWNFGTD